MLVNLISWEYCKKLLELKAEEKTITELIIFSCSAEIELFTDRMLKERQIRELHSGYHNSELTLRQYPVQEINHLRVDKSRGFSDSTTVSPDYYTCHIPGENDDKERPSEIILIDGYLFPKGNKIIEVNYKCGYPEDQVPETLKTATVEMVEWTIKRLKNRQIGEVNLKYGKKTQISTKIPEHVVEMLTPFKRKNW